ncbi:MAG: hypothetical protein GWP05_07225 [Anaerolineaceae bacterium]|nr:hypothetical protein [Anaerolineaceae bacterium]
MPRCPKCKIPLCRIEIQGVAVHTCPDCKGELVEDARLKALERRGDPTWTEAQKDALCELADRSNDLNETICPRCGREMEKFLFRHYANLQVDKCRECGDYWFDVGELEKMQILYHEEITSRTEADRERTEKFARSQTAAETRKAALRDPGRRTSPSPAMARQVGITGGLTAFVARIVALNQELEQIDEPANRIADGIPADYSMRSAAPPGRSLIVTAAIAAVILAVTALALYLLLNR